MSGAPGSPIYLRKHLLIPKNCGSKIIATTRHDSGQSLVEVALCLPLFLILILGTMEIANIGWAAVQVQNAARAGAAFGSQSRAAATDTADIQIAAQNDAPKLTIVTTPAPSTTCQCINTSTGASTGAACNLTACPSPYLITVQVQVNTQATVTPLIHYPGLPASYTLKGRAIMDVLK